MCEPRSCWKEFIEEAPRRVDQIVGESEGVPRDRGGLVGLAEELRVPYADDCVHQPAGPLL